MKQLTFLIAVTLLLAACGQSPQDSTDKNKASGSKIDGTIANPEANTPFVAFNVWVKTGSQNDPAGKEGLAAMTANVLASSATTEDNFETILEKLYPLATSYNSTVDKEMTNFRATVHVDNLDAFYTLFKNALLKPAFKQEDFDRIKKQAVDYVENSRRYGSDEELGKELLSREIFKGTVYEHPEEGYVTSINAITLDDVTAFYQDQYTRENITVAMGGGYPEGFLKKVADDLTVLPEGQPEPVAKPQPPSFEGMHVLIVEKDTKATAISFGYPIDLVRSDDDFPAMMLANSWFGEHRSGASHLYNVIRSIRGMNYGDYSYIEAYPMGHTTQIPPTNVSRRQQFFQIWIRPISMLKDGDMHDRTMFAFRAALREHERLVNEGLTQEEFEKAQQFLRNYVVNFGATTARRLAYRVDDAFYGIEDPGFLNTIQSQIDNLTREDVNAAVKRHLKTGDWQVVFITKDAEALKAKLVDGSATPIEYSGAVDASVLEEDKIIEAWPVNVPPDNIRIIKIDETFEN